MSKELLFSITKKDFDFSFFNGTGNGGQYRNKHANCCRCKHIESGAIGMCQEFRSLDQNKKMAFKRCAETQKFITWVKKKTSEMEADSITINEKVDIEMNNIRIEGRENNKWQELKEQ